VGQITFPYASFEQGHKDGFAKIGGLAEAYRFMVNGYKGGIWRKSANEKRQDKVKEALTFLAKYEEKHGTKADRQLGRVPNVSA
jgi:hypothetical protein